MVQDLPSSQLRIGVLSVCKVLLQTEVALPFAERAMLLKKVSAGWVVAANRHGNPRAKLARKWNRFVIELILFMYVFWFHDCSIVFMTVASKTWNAAAHRKPLVTTPDSKEKLQQKCLL